MRRPGKQHDDSFAAFIFAADPLSRGAAIGVGENGGTRDHIRLLEIIGCHLPAAHGEALFEAGDNRRVAVKFKSEGIGHRFAGEIVFGRAEAAHEDDDLGARYGKIGRCSELFAVIAHDGLKDHFDAKLIEFFGEIKRVRILPERSQQLGANGDDLGVHQ